MRKTTPNGELRRNECFSLKAQGRDIGELESERVRRVHQKRKMERSLVLLLLYKRLIIDR